MKTVFLIVFLFVLVAGFGQTSNICDTVYSSPYAMAEYDGGNEKFMKDVHNILSPTINNCIKEDGQIKTKIYIGFTIDKTGTIVSVDFPRYGLSASCQESLRTEFLKMKGFTPAEIAGNKVCSRFFLPISCLLCDSLKIKESWAKT